MYLYHKYNSNYYYVLRILKSISLLPFSLWLLTFKTLKCDKIVIIAPYDANHDFLIKIIHLFVCF